MNSERPHHSNLKEENGYSQTQDTRMLLTHNSSEQNIHICTYMCHANCIQPSSDKKKIVETCRIRPSHELIDQVMEDEPKLVERTQRYDVRDDMDPTKANSVRETDLSTGYASSTTMENSDYSDNDDTPTDEGYSPSQLHLTKMKWLTETQTDSADSRSSSPCASRSVSFAVPDSSDSDGDMKECVSFGEKCLSTILRLDKEHNMFGLSNITIVDSKILKKYRKNVKDPAFPQTTIIQVCCEKQCCRYKSNTDLPTSLKCGRCVSCTDPFCTKCRSCGIPCGLSCNTSCAVPCLRPARSSKTLPCPKPCGTPCVFPCGTPCSSPCGSPCSPPCGSPCPQPCRISCAKPCRTPLSCITSPCSNCCIKGKIKCKRVPCTKLRCMVDCNTRFGMKISLKRKPKFEPSPVEITPRSSCILQKPAAARSCHHLPRCIPPSSCFPYLMPCFWPPRASAPCNNPSRCFHNPPCRPPRRRKSPIPIEFLCPRNKKCEEGNTSVCCPNPTCPGKNETLKAEIEKRFGDRKTEK